MWPFKKKSIDQTANEALEADARFVTKLLLEPHGDDKNVRVLAAAVVGGSALASGVIGGVQSIRFLWPTADDAARRMNAVCSVCLLLAALAQEKPDGSPVLRVGGVDGDVSDNLWAWSDALKQQLNSVFADGESGFGSWLVNSFIATAISDNELTTQGGLGTYTISLLMAACGFALGGGKDYETIRVPVRRSHDIEQSHIGLATRMSPEEWLYMSGFMADMVSGFPRILEAIVAAVEGGGRASPR